MSQGVPTRTRRYYRKSATEWLVITRLRYANKIVTTTTTKPILRCGFCGGDIPAKRAPSARYCEGRCQHAAYLARRAQRAREALING